MAPCQQLRRSSNSTSALSALLLCIAAPAVMFCIGVQRAFCSGGVSGLLPSRELRGQGSLLTMRAARDVGRSFTNSPDSVGVSSMIEDPPVSNCDEDCMLALMGCDPDIEECDVEKMADMLAARVLESTAASLYLESVEQGFDPIIAAEQKIADAIFYEQPAMPFPKTSIDVDMEANPVAVVQMLRSEFENQYWECDESCMLTLLQRGTFKTEGLQKSFRQDMGTVDYMMSQLRRSKSKKGRAMQEYTRKLEVLKDLDNAHREVETRMLH